MTEKYKIYIPEEMRLRLLNDAELFDFYKKDGSINLNGFLKELLLQYFDEYRETKERLLDTILSDLSAFSSISRDDADAIADKNHEYVSSKTRTGYRALYARYPCKANCRRLWEKYSFCIKK